MDNKNPPKIMAHAGVVGPDNYLKAVATVLDKVYGVMELPPKCAVSTEDLLDLIRSNRPCSN